MSQLLCEAVGDAAVGAVSAAVLLESVLLLSLLLPSVTTQVEGNWHKRPSSLVGWSLHINSFLCTLSFWTSDMEVFSWFCLSKPL